VINFYGTLHPMFPLPVKITKQKKYRIASSELSARRVVDPGFLRKTGRFNRQAFWLTDHPTGCAFPVSQWPIGSVRPRSQQRLVCDGFSPSFLLTDTACLNQHGFCTCAPDTFLHLNHVHVFVNIKTGKTSGKPIETPGSSKSRRQSAVRWTDFGPLFPHLVLKFNSSIFEFADSLF
jgi:hypothetical protein